VEPGGEDIGIKGSEKRSWRSRLARGLL